MRKHESKKIMKRLQTSAPQEEDILLFDVKKKDYGDTLENLVNFSQDKNLTPEIFE